MTKELMSLSKLFDWSQMVPGPVRAVLKHPSPPKQHVSRCVTHLIALLVRTVKHDVNANAAAPALVPAAAQSAAGDGGGVGGGRQADRRDGSAT